MSTPARDELDPDLMLEHWIAIPTFASGDERAAADWAVPVATEVVASRRLAATSVTGIATFLAGIARQDRPDGAPWRFAHLVDPEIGASVWDVAFLEPDDRLTARDLVRAEEDDQLGAEVVDFERNGLAGTQAVRYELADGTPADPQARAATAILAHASITVTRDLPHLGTTSLLAFTTTGHLDSLVVSLEPMQYLLTSDHFAELVAGTF